MNSARAITISDVNITFRKKKTFRPATVVPVLRQISLHLDKGESLGVIGFNGAGKSTLLRLMAGILEPDAGTISTHGLNSALLSLSGGVFHECSGRDNIIMLLMLQQNASLAEAREMVSPVAEFAELTDVIDAPVRTYSSGMVSRLKFSICVRANPDILLVDEVLSVGDLPFAIKSHTAMQEKLFSGATVVFVSHSLFDVYTFCKRAVWLDKGIIRADGPAKEVVQQYKEHCQALGLKMPDIDAQPELMKTAKGQ